MKKKVLSAILSVAMAATLLVGCGSAAEEAPAAATEEAAPAEEAPAEEAEAPAEEEAAPAEEAAAGGGTYAFVSKSAGNPFNERQATGFEEAVADLGGTAIIQHPEAPTADAQITVIQSLISQCNAAK